MLGLLLGDAMNRAHAPDQRLTIDCDDATVRENLLQSLQRARVVRVAEDWGQDDIVCDVEVRIAGRQTIKIASAGARAGYDSGHRQSDNRKGTALCVGQPL